MRLAVAVHDEGVLVRLLNNVLMALVPCDKKMSKKVRPNLHAAVVLVWTGAGGDYTSIDFLKYMILLV